MRTSHQAIYAHELLGALGPGGQLHIRHHRAILHHAQAVAVGVDKHLGQIVELRNQLLQGDDADILNCVQSLQNMFKKKKKKPSEG